MVEDDLRGARIAEAVERLGAATNFCAQMLRMQKGEMEVVLSRLILLAVASLSNPGREEAALEVIIGYLRKGLPLAIEDVATDRLRNAEPAGRS